MGRIISWARQNLVTVFDVIDLIMKTAETVIMALARLVAFTPSTKDDVWVAKLSDFLGKLRGPIKTAKSFLLGTAGS